MTYNPSNVLSEIIQSTSEIVGDGWNTISDLVRQQAKQMIAQASWIARERVNGELQDDELFDFFSDQLKKQVKHLAKTVASLTVATLGQIWDSWVSIIRNSLKLALGAAGLPPWLQAPIAGVNLD